MFYKWGMNVRIRYSKVIQFQSRIIDFLPLPRVRDNPLSPLSAMFNALSFSGNLSPDSPAFSFRSGTQEKLSLPLISLSVSGSALANHLVTWVITVSEGAGLVLCTLSDFRLLHVISDI